MNARIESMSHGDGKVYLQMVLDRLHPDAEVLLDARLKDGAKIPAHLFPFNPLEETSQANYVVVLPHFDVREVDLTFLEYSGEGSPLTQSRLTVELNMMRWRTRFNAFVHNELLEQMFDIEREYCSGRMNVYFTEAIDDGDEIVVKMLADMPQVEGCDVMVDFTDGFGTEIDLPVYPLVDEVVPPVNFGEGERLRIGFSVRVAAAAKEFCVTVYDANEKVPGGFAHFCNETYQPLRESFSYCAVDASIDPRYGRWFVHHCETLAGLEQQRSHPFSLQPQISLVMPIYPGDECYLAAAMAALAQQTYTRFELIMVDMGANELSITSALREWEGDDRVVHLVPESTLEEGAARLTGLLQSKGEACAVLDPSVALAPEALYEYVRRVNEVAAEEGQDDVVGVGACDVAYANHDFFDRDGSLHSPQFKPEFSPDLLYSYNYLGPLVFLSRQVLETVQNSTGFSSESFDYDLVLKATARARRVERIDKVLYHVQNAASISPDADRISARREEEAFRTGRKVLANHLRRNGIDALVLADVSDRLYTVRYRMPEEVPSLSVVVLAGNDAALLDACLTSLEQSVMPRDTPVYVVVNQETSRDVAVYGQHLVRKNRAKVIAYQGPNNRAAMANLGFSQSTSDYVLVLDGDVEFAEPEAVNALLTHCIRKDVGVVGAKILFADDTIRHAGMMVGPYGAASSIGVNLPRTSRGYLGRLLCASNVSAVSLSVMMVKRAAYEKAKGFDERFKISNCEVDFCLKVAKEGYFVAYDGGVEAYRKGSEPDGGASLTKKQMLRAEREKAFLHYRWPRLFVEGDPYMSSCLDARAPYFLLAPAR